MIMVVVFASFILSDNATVKMFGVGLATAVAVDTTIVRCLLVPAIMVLAAKGTWWLPGWLDRLLPQLHVEGDPNALEDIASDDKTRDFGRRPVVLHRPILVVGTALGVVIAWALVTRLPALPFDARTSIAMSAVLGGVLVLLPRFRRRIRQPTVPRFRILPRVILGLIVVGILSIVVPPVPADNGAVTAGHRHRRAACGSCGRPVASIAAPSRSNRNGDLIGALGGVRTKLGNVDHRDIAARSLHHHDGGEHRCRIVASAEGKP